MTSILNMSISIPTPPSSLSSSKSISTGPIPAQSLSLIPKPTHLSLTITIPFKTTPIQMGGGPRTYPGGVSKWQWKRMQAKKTKQLLKARLARERQIYEMRKRAELKAAVAELERPWETVERPPNLFSVGADEQLKVLADRFQRPGGLDLWSERDGPELFRPDNGLQTARFFPKGVVHSVKPYGKSQSLELGGGEEGFEDEDGDEDDLGPGPRMGPIGGYDRKMNVRRQGYGGNSGRLGSRRSDSEGDELGPISEYDGRMSVRRQEYRGNSRNGGLGSSGSKGIGKDGNFDKGRYGKSGSRRQSSSGDTNSRDGALYRKSDGMDLKSRGRDSYGKTNSEDGALYGRRDGMSVKSRGRNSYERRRNMNSEVFDMSLQNDGSYGFEL